MKRFLFCLLFAACGTAAADSLSDATRLLKQGAYGEAFPVFQMLASSGNAEAKLRLGEMYWYGKGLPADRAQGDTLFAEAAKAGNKEAEEALTLSKRRAARTAEIAKWTTYDGADLSAGKYACKDPVIPEVSKKNDEITRITSDYHDWVACYKDLVADLDGSLAPSHRIPADLVVLMSEAEQQQAMTHVNDATSTVVGRVGASARTIMERYDRWEKATTAYVKEQNALAAARAKEQQYNMETVPRNAALNLSKPPPPTASSARH